MGRLYGIKGNACLLLTVGVVLSLPYALRAKQQQSTEPGLSAGALALVEDQGALPQRVREGLVDTNPTTRAAAARIAGVRSLAATADDVVRALDGESDLTVEIELARTLLYLRGNGAVDALLKRPYRGNFRVLVNLANWIASTHPDHLAGHLENLRDRLGDRAGALNPAVLLVAATRPDIGASTIRTWLTLAPADVKSSLMADCRFDLTNADMARLVTESLESPDPGTRQATTWMLVNRVVGGTTLPSGVADALAATKPSNGDSVDLTWEVFGRELLARYRGAPAIDRSEFLKVHAAQHDLDAIRLASASHLSKAERAALRAALGERFPPPGTSPPSSGQCAAVVPQPMRTLPVFWTGFVDSVARAAGCRTQKGPTFGAIRADYAQDGRPSRITIDPGQLPPECVKVLAALARLVLANPHQRAVGAKGELILVPMDQASIACMSAPPDPDRAPPAPGALLRRFPGPKKIRDVAVEYAPDLRRQRVEGVVLIESEISSSGCARTSRVTRGVHPALDAAALRAVSGWRYAPLQLDGEPVPIVMSTGVRFMP